MKTLLDSILGAAGLTPNAKAPEAPRDSEYYARLDRERNERDRLCRRGCDYDGRLIHLFRWTRSLARQAEAAGRDLAEFLSERAPELLDRSETVVVDVLAGGCSCKGECDWCCTPGVLVCGAC